MAGDWIKFRVALLDHPKVLWMASHLVDSASADRRQSVVNVSSMCRQPVGDSSADVGTVSAVSQARTLVLGALAWLWCYADQQSVDGSLPVVTDSIIDTLVSVPGFASALRGVGWLEDSPQGVVLVRYMEHNGKTAKRRASDSQGASARRRQSVGKASSKRRQSVGKTSSPLTTKIRDKRLEIIDTNPPSPFVLPHASDEFKLAWEEWERHRSELRKPLTPTSRKQQLAKLGRMEETEAIAVIRQSIENGWQGLFDLKGNGHGSANKPGGRVGPDSGRVHAPPGKYDHVPVIRAGAEPDGEPDLFSRPGTESRSD